MNHHSVAASSRTIWVSLPQKCKPFWILLEQEMMGWQWHQLDHMQIICTSLQTDNHARQYSTTQFFTCRTSFLLPNQQRQSIEGRKPESDVKNYPKYRRDSVRCRIHRAVDQAATLFRRSKVQCPWSSTNSTEHCSSTDLYSDY